MKTCTQSSTLIGIHVSIRHEGRVHKKAIYVALGITMEGQKEVLGLWISKNEGAKFWLSVLTDLQNRGLQDVLIFCVDGLTGFPEAMEAVYPKAKIQLCVVHMVRNSKAPKRSVLRSANNLLALHRLCE